MNALFGESRVKSIQSKSKSLNKVERKKFIIEQLVGALKDMGYKFVHHFRFKNIKGKSYYLMFVTKKFIGYDKMKGIMAKESTSSPQGVPSYEYSPEEKRGQALISYDRPLDDLCNMLLDEYAGQELTVWEIYKNHSVDRPYILKNYQKGLRKLYDDDKDDGKIEAKHPKGKLRKKTMPKEVRIKFPRKEVERG